MPQIHPFVTLLITIAIIFWAKKRGGGKNYLWILVFMGFSGYYGSMVAERTPIKDSPNFVQEKIYLKELTTGIKLNQIKGISYRVFERNIYTFNYNYFGGKRDVKAEVNASGEIYKLGMILDNNFETLKTGLLEKLSEQNKKTVNFDCRTEKTTPDASATLNYKTCKVKSDTQTLTVQESTMQPTAKVMGLPQLPFVLVTIELEDAKLRADHIEAEDAKYRKKTQQLDEKKKGDI